MSPVSCAAAACQGISAREFGPLVRQKDLNVEISHRMETNDARTKFQLGFSLGPEALEYAPESERPISA